MKKLCANVIILSMIGASFLYSDELSEKKARLERQIADLEAKQNKQKEIEELERRLQQLQSKADEELSSKNSSSYQSPKTTQQTTQTPYQNPYAEVENVITQEINDEEESKKWFGKNRSGVLLGLAGGTMPIEYRAKDGSHSAKGKLGAGGVRLGYQYFKNNNSILGFRLYLDEHLAMNETEDALTSIFQNLVAFNLDILVDFRIPNTYTYVGLFGGVGTGSLDFKTISSSIWRSDLSLEYTGGFYNFGVALTFAAKHRLELYCKTPTKTSYNENFYWKTSTLVTLAYQYTF